MAAYMSTLAVNDTFNHAGLPDKGLPVMEAREFCLKGASMAGRHVGNRKEALAMLKLASQLNTKSWVEPVDMSEIGGKKDVEMVKANKARCRVTLVNQKTMFGSSK